MFLMGQPQRLFRLNSVFSNQQYNFYNKSMRKMSFQYMAPVIQTHNLSNVSRLP